jgi:hypothetical protein
MRGFNYAVVVALVASSVAFRSWPLAACAVALMAVILGHDVAVEVLLNKRAKVEAAKIEQSAATVAALAEKVAVLEVATAQQTARLNNMGAVVGV